MHFPKKTFFKTAFLALLVSAILSGESSHASLAEEARPEGMRTARLSTEEQKAHASEILEKPLTRRQRIEALTAYLSPLGYAPYDVSSQQGKAAKKLLMNVPYTLDSILEALGLPTLSADVPPLLGFQTPLRRPRPVGTFTSGTPLPNYPSPSFTPATGKRAEEDRIFSASKKAPLPTPLRRPGQGAPNFLAGIKGFGGKAALKSVKSSSAKKKPPLPADAPTPHAADSRPGQRPRSFLAGLKGNLQRTRSSLKSVKSSSAKKKPPLPADAPTPHAADSRPDQRPPGFLADLKGSLQRTRSSLKSTGSITAQKMRRQSLTRDDVEGGSALSERNFQIIKERFNTLQLDLIDKKTNLTKEEEKKKSLPKTHRHQIDSLRVAIDDLKEEIELVEEEIEKIKEGNVAEILEKDRKLKGSAHDPQAESKKVEERESKARKEQGWVNSIEFAYKDDRKKRVDRITLLEDKEATHIRTKEEGRLRNIACAERKKCLQSEFDTAKRGYEESLRSMEACSNYTRFISDLESTRATLKEKIAATKDEALRDAALRAAKEDARLKTSDISYILRNLNVDLAGFEEQIDFLNSEMKRLRKAPAADPDLTTDERKELTLLQELHAKSQAPQKGAAEAILDRMDDIV